MGDKLLGYGPQGLALEVNPWQTKASVDAALLYRGAIVAGWASVETTIIELAIRASGHEAYVGHRKAYPTKLKTRVAYLRDILSLPGPLDRYADDIGRIVDHYVESADLRNMLAHAFMEVYPQWGATFSGFRPKDEATITQFRKRLTEEQLEALAVEATQYSRDARSLLGRINQDAAVPSLEGTSLPPSQS